MGKIANAVIGGWGLSGIFHWTSGLPFSMGGGAGWPTNWQLQGEAVQTAPTGKIGVFRDSAGNPNMFKDTTQASAAFRFPTPENRDSAMNCAARAILSWTTACGRLGTLPKPSF